MGHNTQAFELCPNKSPLRPQKQSFFTFLSFPIPDPTESCPQALPRLLAECAGYETKALRGGPGALSQIALFGTLSHSEGHALLDSASLPQLPGRDFLLPSNSKMCLVRTEELSRRKLDVRLLGNRVCSQRPHVGAPRTGGAARGHRKEAEGRCQRKPAVVSDVIYEMPTRLPVTTSSL